MAKEIAKMGNTPLSVIDSVGIPQVKKELSVIELFQKTVHEQLSQGTDFDTIPGTGSKPTLLKPGAEKILMILGLTSKYEIIDKVEDNQKGFFSYTIKSFLYKGDQLITEGLGNSNTKERKFASRDGFTMQNTVLKMAKKRAQVDAALTVGSLSNLFTQDVEDMGIPKKPETRVQRKVINKVTAEQEEKIATLIQRLKKISGLSDSEVFERLKINSIPDLSEEQAKRCIPWLEKQIADLKPKEEKTQPHEIEKNEPIEAQFNEAEFPF